MNFFWFVHVYLICAICVRINRDANFSFFLVKKKSIFAVETCFTQDRRFFCQEGVIFCGRQIVNSKSQSPNSNKNTSTYWNLEFATWNF